MGSYSTMKCQYCKKKSHLEFTCQCKKLFCIACRLPEVHECTEYKSNPVVLVKVVASKVETL